jgi:peptidoglycan hydrolase-like protein with peptidoglycan-binding domain
VKSLQQALNLLVPRSSSLLAGSQLPALIEDGIFGPKTQARVKEFQAIARLKTDGIVGALTTKSLMAATLSSTFSHKRR